MQKLDLKNMTLTERIKFLTAMIEDRLILQAFEKFYAEEVIMHENQNKCIEGKDNCRKRQEEFVLGLIDYKNTAISNVIICEDKSAVVWDIDFTHETYGHQSLQVKVIQHWNSDGEIISEEYFTNEN
nr:hypothetical protein [uncultured Carboxylicivirga sp.]